MLLDQLIDGRSRGQAEKPNTIELSLLAFDDSPDSLQPRPLGKPAVEQIIELRELLRILAGLFLRFQARFGILPDVLGDPLLRRAPDDGDFERLAHKSGALHGFERDPADEASTLRQNIDQPVLREPDQRLADGRTARAEPQSKLVLGQLFARHQPERDNVVAKDRVDRSWIGRVSHRRYAGL